jgi:indole-3-glycerol phosphate synthase
MPVTLGEILERTRQNLPAAYAQREELEREAASRRAPPPFGSALRRPNVAVIAEVKRRSPSAGPIRQDLDPRKRAIEYASHGAAAISVLTDAPFFGGSLSDLRGAAEACSIPVLRKDFIIDEIQIVEARAAGASAVLLIVRALPPIRLKSLLGFAAGIGLEALVEVHTEIELTTALEADSRIIGVNSRDLDTFRTDAVEAWKLLHQIPSDRVAVGESGISSQTDVVRAAAAGADAVLVGTALSAATAPSGVLRALSRVPRNGR